MSNIPIDPNKFAAAFKKNNSSIDVVAPSVKMSHPPPQAPVKIVNQQPKPVSLQPSVVQPSVVQHSVVQPSEQPQMVVTVAQPSPTVQQPDLHLNNSEEKSNKYTIIAFAVIIIILIIVIVYFVSNYAPNIYSKLPFISAPAPAPIAAAICANKSPAVNDISNEENMRKIAELASNKTEPISIEQINEAANAVQEFEPEQEFETQLEPEVQQDPEPEQVSEVQQDPEPEPEPPIVKKKQGKVKKAKIVEIKNDDIKMEAGDIFDFDL